MSDSTEQDSIRPHRSRADDSQSNCHLVTTSAQPLESVWRELRIAGSIAWFVATLGIYVAFRIELPSGRIVKRNAEEEGDLATVIDAMMIHHR